MRRLRDRSSVRASGRLFRLLALGLCMAGCGLVELPTPSAPPLPPLTIARPALSGAAWEPYQEIDTLTEAVACLAAGHPVYGVVQGNSNVRAGVGTEACLLGKAASGLLVRVDGIYQHTAAGEALVLAQRTSRVDGVDRSWPVGYLEDIQPIFQSNCAACHDGQVRSGELQVTTYEELMTGSKNGPVVLPGEPSRSRLWHQVESGMMPLVGELAALDKALIRAWIEAGAPPSRSPGLTLDQLWFEIADQDVNALDGACPAALGGSALINGALVRLASCGELPVAARVAALRQPPVLPRAAPELAASDASERTALSPVEAGQPPDGGETGDGGSSAAADAVQTRPQVPAAPASGGTVSATQVGIRAAALGLNPPTEGDEWLIPQGGFCIEQHLPRLQDQVGITAMAFAPDGRLFLALDAPSTAEPDPLVFFDAFHPSRSILVYKAGGDGGTYPILTESSRVVGMAYGSGALYLNRAGEVGRIVDGGSYERLARGFAVNGRLFHANNGLVIVDGWLYVSAGGVRDGYSDGVIAPGAVGERPAESVALEVASDGNAYAARLVRAPLDRLLRERSIGAFTTAARGFRNPYGMARDPLGRLWITDNGATNVPGTFSAGDEINLFDPRSLSAAAAAAAAAGDETATPFYGFPIALSGSQPDWYTRPVLTLANATAPTGITWAYDTLFYAHYGRFPGLYRMARSAADAVVAERILFAWPIVAVTSAPDGAVWIGTGGGGVYRISPGCG